MILFEPNGELLELQAMEMDTALVSFFREELLFGEQDEATLSFVNADGLERKIKVSMKDKLLQGRGIKGFFAPMLEAGYLLAVKLPDGNVQMRPPGIIDAGDEPDWMTSQPRAASVARSMSLMQRQNDQWFDLYEASQMYSAHRVGELISLPHIRDLQPYEYQIRAVQTVLGRLKGRAMLCDEVGLGKTVEAGICIQEYIMRGLAKKILILAPPSLINQWSEEMKRKFNQDFVRSDQDAFTSLEEEAWQAHSKVIASLTTAKRANHSKAIAQIEYDMVIVDEAHHIKNRNTVAWKFVNSLKKKYMLLLTATPVQNSLEELYNLITLLKPGQLKTYQQFRKSFVEDNRGIEVKNASKLKSLLAEVMIRNRRSNVDVRFTRRKSETKIIPLAAAERKLYDDISAFIRTHYAQQHPYFSRFLLKSMQEQMGSLFSSLTRSLGRLTEQKQLTALEKKNMQRFLERAQAISANELEHNGKIVELAKIVEQFQDKIIVFTKYKSTLEVLVQALRQRGLQVAEFHGDLRRNEKEREIASFRDSAQVLISTEVGGEGRNLQFCNGLVNFDLPWNPMAIEQRIGRIHRIGQQRDVFVYNLAAQHTLEHHMLRVLDQKINLFELVVGEVDMILGDIDEGEQFADVLMDAWVQSDEQDIVSQEMDKIGDKLLANKQQLEKVKQLDEKLFF